MFNVKNMHCTVLRFSLLLLYEQWPLSGFRHSRGGRGGRAVTRPPLSSPIDGVRPAVFKPSKGRVIGLSGGAYRVLFGG